MGGPGSGNWYRWDKKTTLDETKRIDIRYMRKQGLLKPGYTGSLSWTSGGKPSGSIQFACQQDYLQLNYRYKANGEEWALVEEFICFDRTSCNYGGERLWFLCPCCNKRVALLCLYRARFLCRHCHKLSYSSQQESGMDRVINRKHNLGERIFEDYEYGEGWRKKKGMHQKTFDRLRKRYVKYEQSISNYISAHFNTHW